MRDELVKDLRICAEGERCDKCGKWEVKQNGGRNACEYAICTEAADAIEELSKLADAIPHVCECCIGCEVESGGCDNAFVLSPKRAREYLSKPHWIPAVERKIGKWLTKEYMYGDPSTGVEDMLVERRAELSDFYAYCSVCGRDAGYNAEQELILSAYCPNCGADMREES